MSGVSVSAGFSVCLGFDCITAIFPARVCFEGHAKPMNVLYKLISPCLGACGHAGSARMHPQGGRLWLASVQVGMRGDERALEAQ